MKFRNNFDVCGPHTSENEKIIFIMTYVNKSDFIVKSDSSVFRDFNQNIKRIEIN